LSRREYYVNLFVNGQQISRVVIDPHFEEKHAGTITDDIILGLVKLIDGKDTDPDDEDLPYFYFTSDKLEFNGKPYKLVWLLEVGQDYIGVVNAYRR
jgi:hypothetical protein